ncbi:major facilitator superfamily-like protein [Fragilaria crotonensis]|nr:major facilitator superfamily-like protein [Fragilaria crotonensis]
MASDGEISVDSDILNGRSNVSSSPEECTRSITQENDSASEIEGNEGGNNVHDSYFNFLSTYFRSMPAVHLLPVALFMAMGVGSTVGVVPALMADRYARLHYGYDGEEMCLSYTNNKPEACQKGASAAQEAAAMMTLVTNILALFCNSVIGSFSDAHGRRLVLVFSTFLSTISPVVLVVMQVLPAMDPFWYYAASCAVGPVNYVSISFTILSDVIPTHYRTPGFGLFIGTYFLGFSGSPSVARWLSCWQVSIFSSVVVIVGFMYTYLIFVALCLSQLTKTNFPILSSLASTHATEYQQGSIQGALFALSALANAIGPIILQLVYKATADGTMFVAASALYLIGTMVVAFIPSEKRQETIEPTTTDFNQMEEPLLSLSEGGETPVSSNC